MPGTTSRTRPSEPPASKPSIARSIVIDASPERVWEAISTPGVLEIAHPFCRENPVASWPGIGSKDRIVYYNGLVMERQFVRWVDGVGYDLEIRPAGRDERSSVAWRIGSEADDKASLSITIYPAVGALGRRQTDRLLKLLGRYLDSVVRGFEHYLRTGQPVRRNQFGAHRMFSGAPKDGSPQRA